MLNLHRLRLLVELSRRGTVTEVAKALSYSPSTVSEQLDQLEREAGSSLLEQVGRRLHFTAAGDLLVEHAERILIEVDRAEAALAVSRAVVGGVVRMATFQTAALSLVPLLLDELERRYPSVTLIVSEIQPEAGTAALLARDFDLVLGETYPGRPIAPSRGVDQQHLLSDPMHLYAPHLNKARHSRAAALESFADMPWVMEPAGKPARTWSEALCREAGFEPEVRFESADLLVHVRLAETGKAVALVPDLVWGTELPIGHLMVLPGHPARDVYTAVRSGAETRPVLVALRQALKDITSRLVSNRAASRS